MAMLARPSCPKLCTVYLHTVQGLESAPSVPLNPAYFCAADFLEALGRMADMKSLPLDSDLDSAGGALFRVLTCAFF